MTTPLARLLADALRIVAHPIESVAGVSSRPAELLTLAEHGAEVLRRGRVRRDEPVHVRMGNRPADLASLLAVWQAGGVAVPVHVGAAPGTIARVQRITGARFLIDAGVLEEFRNATPPQREMLRDAALVIFTSGSTGEPKGVVIAHDRFADKVSALARLLKFQSNDLVLVPLQLTFIFGLWVSLLAMLAGARLLLVRKFTREAILQGLSNGATILAGVPSMFRTLLADASFRAPGLRIVLSGGEPLPKRVAENILGFAPQVALYDLYGSTETGSCDFCLMPREQPQGFGTIGTPTEGVEFRIRPLTDQKADTAEAGELQIRTPFGMLGYLDQPGLTGASHEDGYFRTGDLARTDRKGRVVLVGRSKEIISRGGMKIAPLEVESLLCEHPEVAAALCAGVPDERLGETMHALVVPRVDAQLDPATLRQWLLARTERFKVPDSFLFKDALPLGPTGKLDRRALASLILEARKQSK
jgi:long-chain acyl-CoA synthetase